ncbi:scavenger receptor class B member 1 [Harpegnathos saltator]|uniref:Scavenger receptor class B member 1 n=1 Tax=Harpegnathos saltator TaxID=610380 RepID=E2BXL2_HARSA|nr:scavenger receptor class B member 1 [Harpegnathos saltator]XP_025161924.1 scavenger receptor class B member 1 [Harpegnathos saltator]EFN79581.1 Scavenger receptor class B member 1 [Harpegnathos saltator]
MKTTLTLQQFKKCIISFIAGIMCTSLAYVIYIVDPIKIIMEYNIEMRPNSFLFRIWQKPPVDIYINVYIFNITNPVEFLSGKEKLKVQEIGPYVYQEILENNNVTFNDNGTMTFIPKRTVVFIPELSINDPKKDFVKIPNVPFLGVSSALHNAGFLVNYPVIQLANMMNAKPFLNISVYDYLWGYEDSLVALVSGIVPNFINFRKFGLLDRMYDEGENMVTLQLRKNDDMRNEKGRYLSIDKYNGSPGLAQWGYVDTLDNETLKENTACNTLQGATEGIIFPSHLDKNATFRVFRKMFCRPLPITFQKEVWTKYGLPGYYYVLADNFADPPEQNPDNECYCRKKACLKRGLSDLTPCTYNIPMAVSLPHFLNADPSLLEDIEGLNPDEEKHMSYAIVQSTIGIPLNVHSRIQTNLIMHHTHYNSKIFPFNDMAIPLFWFDMFVPSVSTYFIFMLRLINQILPAAQTVLIYLLGIIGMVTTVWSFGRFLRLLNQQWRKKQEVLNVDFDIKIPLYNGQQASITVLPTIKKTITSTEIFS